MGTTISGSISISHLLLANDTMLFFGASSRDQILHIQAILMCFEAVSGLKVNFSKIELVLVGDAVGFEGLAWDLCYKKRAIANVLSWHALSLKL